MFRFNKDIEYALISLMAMSKIPDEQRITARELSVRYEIPFKHLARILQKLGADGIVLAVKGLHGGYSLAMSLSDIRLGRVIKAVRGDEHIADCLPEGGKCVQDACGCIIKPMIRVFQDKWVAFVENTTLGEFIQTESI